VSWRISSSKYDVEEVRGDYGAEAVIDRSKVRGLLCCFFEAGFYDMFGVLIECC
jgi:hypothetical protein